MSSGSHPKAPQLDPIQGVLEIIERASMTGTNKLGLLLALLDLAPEKMEGDGRVSKRELATRCLAIHWEHGRALGNVKLRQSSSRKKRHDGTFARDTTVMIKVHELRDLLDRLHAVDTEDLALSRSLKDLPLEVVLLEMAGSRHKDTWDAALDDSLTEIGDSLWKNPVSRLHNLSGSAQPFLYRKIPRRNEISFLDGVAEQLTRFSGVLKPLVEFRFAGRVAEINKISSSENDIRSHLFAHERLMPPGEVRNELLSLQKGVCIYTDAELGESSSLDHVVPWSRNRVSQIENLVMTTKKANSSKSNSLLGPDLVIKWHKHVVDNHKRIKRIADEYSWPTDFDRVRRVALHTYRASHASTGVWKGEGVGVRPLGKKGRDDIIEILSRTLL